MIYYYIDNVDNVKNIVQKTEDFFVVYYIYLYI